MGGKGVVAILAGNQNAPNLQKRVQGVKNAAAKYPGIKIRDTYYHKETPQDAAARVEQVMQSHPDVSACIVVPMRASQTLFRLKAIVTPAGRKVPDIRELRAWAKERLTAYKVPRVFEVRESLPRSATGKVLRHLLEAESGQ